jgi:hypothetical protein
LRAEAKVEGRVVDLKILGDSERIPVPGSKPIGRLKKPPACRDRCSANCKAYSDVV